MSSGTTTRGHLSEHYDRLKSRVETVKLRDDLQKEFVVVVKSVLDMYLIDGAASASFAMPDPDEVEGLLHGLFPSPVELLTDSFFRAPLFALVSLFKVADLYGCVSPKDPLCDHLELREVDRTNKNITAHVWFADFLGCDSETILESIARYKESRGTPESLRSSSVVPSRADPRTEQDQPSDNTPGAEKNTAQRPNSGSGSINREEQVASPRCRAENHPPSFFDPPDVRESNVNDSRKATNVFQYFKDNKFTGDLSQSIDMTLRDYNVCARQHRLSPRQKADFFINVLSGPARTFFFNNARDDMSFVEMARMMAGEYNSDSRQLQVQGMLETLRLDKHMSEHDVSSSSEGLTQIIDLIERLTPQCQPQFRSDANKINYLRKAVLGFLWAMTPIGNIITEKYSFNGFVTSLREHMQLENEVKMAPASANTHFTDGGTYHQQYGRRPKFLQKHGNPLIRCPTLVPLSRLDLSLKAAAKVYATVARISGVPATVVNRDPSAPMCGIASRTEMSPSIPFPTSFLMEGELEENAAPSEDEEGEGRQNDVHFSGAQDELAVFEGMLGAETALGTHFAEQSDKEWFRNHLSSSFCEDQSTAQILSRTAINKASGSPPL